MAELQLAKECEAVIRRGLRDLAERHKREAEKQQMLREALENLAANPPLPF
jgi:Arc/MetJ-type ribon-helix-helix transcriptional regulator